MIVYERFRGVLVMWPSFHTGLSVPGPRDRSCPTKQASHREGYYQPGLTPFSSGELSVPFCSDGPLASYYRFMDPIIPLGFLPQDALISKT